ncbi:MAG: helix-turn-helix transcriptional regulator [Spirochaetales bacterium]|nr:helix-turn-helix transcriptional regulator [Spirochaetales bacterium]
MKPSSMLKALRQEQSMTQKQLAEAVGISTTAISAMENDSRQISLAMAERLAKVLVTNPKVFLDPALLETIIL